MAFSSPRCLLKAFLATIVFSRLSLAAISSTAAETGCVPSCTATLVQPTALVWSLVPDVDPQSASLSGYVRAPPNATAGSYEATITETVTMLYNLTDGTSTLLTKVLCGTKTASETNVGGTAITTVEIRPGITTSIAFPTQLTYFTESDYLWSGVLPTGSGNDSTCASQSAAATIAYPSNPPQISEFPDVNDILGSCFTPVLAPLTVGAEWFASVYPSESALQSLCEQTFTTAFYGQPKRYGRDVPQYSSRNSTRVTVFGNTTVTASGNFTATTSGIATKSTAESASSTLVLSSLAASTATLKTALFLTNTVTHTVGTRAANSPGPVVPQTSTPVTVLPPTTKPVSHTTTPTEPETPTPSPEKTPSKESGVTASPGSGTTETTSAGLADIIASAIGLVKSNTGYTGPTTTSGESLVAITPPAGSSISEIMVDGHTITPGGAAVVVSGTTYSAAPTGNAIVVNGVTSSIGSTPDSGASADSSSVSAFIFNGHTVVAGESGTVDSGTTYSLAQGGSAIVVNGVTSTLWPVAAGSHATSGGVTATAAAVSAAAVKDSSVSALVFASQTLTAGNAVTMSGTTYSLAHGGKAIVVNGVASTLGPSGTVTLGSLTATPTVVPAESQEVVESGTTYTLPTKVFTLTSGGVVIGSQTLLPGSTIVVAGKTLSLDSSSSVHVVEPSSVLATDGAASALSSAINGAETASSSKSSDRSGTISSGTSTGSSSAGGSTSASTSPDSGGPNAVVRPSLVLGSTALIVLLFF